MGAFQRIDFPDFFDALAPGFRRDLFRPVLADVKDLDGFVDRS